MTAPKLLTDEQMRQYLVDGYLVFQPSVPDQIHPLIRSKLDEIIFSDEANPGNNILPRVPEMRHILNCPEVRGALISVLGPGYLEHPHRFCHPLGPVDEPPADAAEKLARNCHQDGYTPLGRPRQHYSRFARIMYYPQDTPTDLGPTHVIPGTQYNRGLTDEDRAAALPWAGKAGSVSLTHFDIGHAAGVNHLPQSRHMIKFIYVRATQPEAPTWDCQSLDWQRPESRQYPYDIEGAWAHNWDWLCGKSDRYASLRALPDSPRSTADLIADIDNGKDLATRLEAIRNLTIRGPAATAAVPALTAMLGTDHQAVRIGSTYALGGIGTQAVEALADNLRAAGQRQAAHPVPQPWNEGAINMEDAAQALAAVGPASLDALVALLDDSNEWTRLNAAFALGEMDDQAAPAVTALSRCLADPSHRVVRTATDSLSSIRRHIPAFIDPLERLLTDRRPDWNEELTRHWTGGDQVRTNAAMAFARLGADGAQAADSLLAALDDPCGHVGAFALNALQRLDSPAALQAVADYLQSQRWDNSLHAGRQF
ncbi:MAG: hypothetical protein GKR89_06060 [Candidatus Latescibacteria bacterium]|nr:hypothetical protein [Candidatus Latescibacterota bacterium]